MSVSIYFAQQNEPETDDLADSFINLENDLVSQLNNLNYGPNVEYIYSPLDYASNLHKAFLTKFLLTKKKVLFLGINPGPWGMCQTGVRIQFFIFKIVSKIMIFLIFRYHLVKLILSEII